MKQVKQEDEIFVSDLTQQKPEHDEQNIKLFTAVRVASVSGSCLM